MVTLQHHLILSVALFVIGATGVVVRRNVLVMFMSVEIMLASVNVALLAFSRWTLLPNGQALAMFIMAVMAAEAAVGLALVVAFFRLRRTVFVDEMKLLKG
ncbi:MAG TPA: NADH-quinone oxidoreductase subunit NuoK [bacterium]|nr:NADH-quinone oxidoreductase subunit NuoK [bacterium]